MKYQLAIFDFDGTLADSFPAFRGIMNRMAEQYGFRPIEDQDLEYLRTLDPRQLFKHLGIPFWKLPWLTRQIRKMVAEEAGGISLFPGIEQFLRRLHAQGAQLAIVSSNSWDNIRMILGPENSALFLHAACDATLFGKRSKLRQVLRKCGQTPVQAIYIGDELRDLEAARAEQIAFGAVIWGHTPLKLFLPHDPEVVFESVDLMAATLAPPAANPPYIRHAVHSDDERAKR